MKEKRTKSAARGGKFIPNHRSDGVELCLQPA